MLSNLLNMSDSVPPDHKRFSTMSHFFRRELSRKQMGSSEGTEKMQGIICEHKKKICQLDPSPLGGQPRDPPQLLQRNASILLPLHLYSQFLNQPLAFFWQMVSDQPEKTSNASPELNLNISND